MDMAERITFILISLVLMLGSANELFEYKDQFGVTGQAKSDSTGLNNPYGVAVASDGTILVTNKELHRIVKLDADLGYIDFYNVDGLKRPRGIAIDGSGNVFVSDTDNHRLIKLDASFQVATQFGTKGQPKMDNTGLNYPQDIAIDATGNVFVADMTNNRVVKLTNDLQYVTHIGVRGSVRRDESGFDRPRGLEIDGDGFLYVTDTNENHRVMRFDKDLNFVDQFGFAGESRTDDTGFNDPLDVTIGLDGMFYVTDGGNDRIVVLTPSFDYVGEFDVTDIEMAGETGFDPKFSTLDAHGRLLIADMENHRIVRLGRPSDTYWDTQLPKKKTVTITEKTSSDLRDVQVKVTLDTASMVSAGELNSDCGDLRFVDPEHGSLPYHITSGCNSAATVIWVRVPVLKGGASRELTLRHGNSGWTGRSSYEQTMTPLRPDSSTVGLWHMDEGGGTAIVDTSGKANHGEFGYQRLTSTGNGLPIDESADYWGSTAPRSLETTNIKEGSGAMKVGGQTNQYKQVATVFQDARDVSQWEIADDQLRGTLQYWVYINDASLSVPLDLEFGMENNGYGVKWHDKWPQDWSTGWNHVKLGFEGISYYNVGSINWAQVAWMEFYASVDAPTNYFIFDDFRMVSDPEWSDGVFGKAIELDGDVDYLQVSDSPELHLGKGITLEARIKLSAYSGDWVLVAGKAVADKRNYGLWISRDGELMFQMKGLEGDCNIRRLGGAGDPATLNAGTWYHVAGSYDGSNGKLYVDGVEVHSDACTITPDDHDDMPRLGFDGEYAHLNGALDEVAIYNRALSADEIKAHAEGRVYIAQEPEVVVSEPLAPPPDPALVAQWHFDETSGDTTADATGNGHTATLVGATRVDGVSGKALSFSGSDQTVLVTETDDIDMVYALTVEAWVRPEAREDMSILSKRWSYGIRIIPDGRQQLGIWADGENTVVGTTAAIPLDEWSHVAYTFDGTFMRIYVDGVEAGSREFTAGTKIIKGGPSGIFIGSYDHATGFYKGLIDEVSIYNYALSATEVKSHAEAITKPTPEPTTEATVEPTAEATAEPTVEATVGPTTGPTTGPTVAPTVPPSATETPRKHSNGGLCSSVDECSSGNCGNGVCCVAGMTCCITDADCPPDQECSDRFYCQAPDATPVPEPTVEPTATPEATAVPSGPSPTISTIGTPTPPPTGSPVVEPVSTPAAGGETGTEKKINGQSCTATGECSSGNCGAGICCLAGERCCATDADCLEEETCNTVRSYCVQLEATPIPTEKPADQVTDDDAKAELSTALKMAGRAREQHLDTLAIDDLLTEAQRELDGGNSALAYKLAIQARTEAEKELAAVKKDPGEPCRANDECGTTNCNNVCCTAGHICCTKDADCMVDEFCDVERFYCSEVEEGERALTVQERLIEIMDNPIELISVVAAIVGGVGFGIYQLRSRISEDKEHDEEQRKLEELQRWQQQQQQQAQQPQQWDQSQYQQGQWDQSNQQQGWDGQQGWE